MWERQITNESIVQEFCEFRAKCGLLWCYDWVSIPMVYTQVSAPGYLDPLVFGYHPLSGTWTPAASSIRCLVFSTPIYLLFGYLFSST